VSPPRLIHDHRQPGPTADRDNLARGRQHPGEVADRRRHRLRREEGQLAHVTDTKRPDDDARRGAAMMRRLPPRAVVAGSGLPVPARSWLAPRMLDSENPPTEPGNSGSRGGLSLEAAQMERTPVAWGPLGLCPTSNSTLWFSSRVRKPLPWISV